MCSSDLFARMVLVLLAGLIVAQLASFAVHWRERGEYMTRAMGMRSAARIADIIELLDSIEPAERAKIVSVFSSPLLRIALDVPPLAPQVGDVEKEEQVAQFTAALRRTVVADIGLVVNAIDAPQRRGPGGPWGGRGPGMEGRMMEGRPPFDGGMPPGDRGFDGPRRFGAAFIVQAKLKDGTLVTFNARSPQENAVLPVQLLMSLGVLLAVVIVVTLIAVRWVTRPLNTLAAAAQSLGEDINRPPLDEGGPLEVSRAARAFNSMQQKLAKFINDRTRIFAAMSHDLKTPITRLRLRTELLDDAELRAKFVKDLAEMEAMVSSALDFMRGVDNKAPTQPVDVNSLLESLVNDARETGGEVALEGEAHSPYPAHAQALKRCIGNLIDNALKYGGKTALAVTDTSAQLTIAVCDEGPGIPAADLERVFEPFYRLEESRNRETGGSGLGLSIARNIARAYGGDVVLKNREGGGLEALVTLPRTKAESAADERG